MGDRPPLGGVGGLGSPTSLPSISKRPAAAAGDALRSPASAGASGFPNAVSSTRLTPVSQAGMRGLESRAGLGPASAGGALHASSFLVSTRGLGAGEDALGSAALRSASRLDVTGGLPRGASTKNLLPGITDAKSPAPSLQRTLSGRVPTSATERSDRTMADATPPSVSNEIAGKSYGDIGPITRTCFTALGKSTVDGRVNFTEFKMILAMLGVRFNEPRAFQWFLVPSRGRRNRLTYEDVWFLLYLVSTLPACPSYVTLRDAHAFFSIENSPALAKDLKARDRTELAHLLGTESVASQEGRKMASVPSDGSGGSRENSAGNAGSVTTDGSDTGGSTATRKRRGGKGGSSGPRKRSRSRPRHPDSSSDEGERDGGGAGAGDDEFSDSDGTGEVHKLKKGEAPPPPLPAYLRPGHADVVALHAVLNSQGIKITGPRVVDIFNRLVRKSEKKRLTYAQVREVFLKQANAVTEIKKRTGSDVLDATAAALAPAAAAAASTPPGSRSASPGTALPANGAGATGDAGATGAAAASTKPPTANALFSRLATVLQTEDAEWVRTFKAAVEAAYLQRDAYTRLQAAKAAVESGKAIITKQMMDTLQASLTGGAAAAAAAMAAAMPGSGGAAAPGAPASPDKAADATAAGAPKDSKQSKKEAAAAAKKAAEEAKKAAEKAKKRASSPSKGGSPSKDGPPSKGGSPSKGDGDGEEGDDEEEDPDAAAAAVAAEDALHPRLRARRVAVTQVDITKSDTFQFSKTMRRKRLAELRTAMAKQKEAEQAAADAEQEPDETDLLVRQLLGRGEDAASGAKGSKRGAAAGAKAGAVRSQAKTLTVRRREVDATNDAIETAAKRHALARHLAAVRHDRLIRYMGEAVAGDLGLLDADVERLPSKPGGERGEGDEEEDEEEEPDSSEDELEQYMAQQKVLAERQKDLYAELDLSSKGLTHLPTEYWQEAAGVARLASTVVFDVSENSLQGLPELYEMYVALGMACKKLNISANKIVKLPEHIGVLASLVLFNAHSNRIERLPDTISSCRRLRVLVLHGNRLAKLPDTIGELTELQTLHIQNNAITVLPESLGKLTKLRDFNASGNKLRFVPYTLAACTAMLRLDLRNNEIHELPPSLGDMTGLQCLLVSNNKLRELPASLGRAASLQILEADSNQLRVFPDSFARFRELLSLSAENNEIWTLDPPLFEGLQALQYLNLSGNLLETLPHTLGRCVYLHDLRLARNKLLHIPVEIAGCKCLKRLDLRGNHLGRALHDDGTLAQDSRLMDKSTAKAMARILAEVRENFAKEIVVDMAKARGISVAAMRRLIAENGGGWGILGLAGTAEAGPKPADGGKRKKGEKLRLLTDGNGRPTAKATGDEGWDSPDASERSRSPSPTRRAGGGTSPRSPSPEPRSGTDAGEDDTDGGGGSGSAGEGSGGASAAQDAARRRRAKDRARQVAEASDRKKRSKVAATAAAAGAGYVVSADRKAGRRATYVRPPLPASIGTLPNLEWVDLAHNNAILLTPELALCPKLRYLNVSHNKLSGLPPLMCRCPTLQILDLSHNVLELLPGEMGEGLSELVTLDVSHNRLERVPETFGHLPRIAHLYLTTNRLVNIPSTLGHLIGQLVTLDFQDNPMHELPQPLPWNRLKLDDDDEVSGPVGGVGEEGGDLDYDHTNRGGGRGGSPPAKGGGATGEGLALVRARQGSRGGVGSAGGGAMGAAIAAIGLNANPAAGGGWRTIFRSGMEGGGVDGEGSTPSVGVPAPAGAATHVHTKGTFAGAVERVASRGLTPGAGGTGGFSAPPSRQAPGSARTPGRQPTPAESAAAAAAVAAANELDGVFEQISKALQEGDFPEDYGPYEAAPPAGVEGGGSRTSRQGGIAAARSVPRPVNDALANAHVKRIPAGKSIQDHARENAPCGLYDWVAWMEELTRSGEKYLLRDAGIFGLSQMGAGNVAALDEAVAQRHGNGSPGMGGTASPGAGDADRGSRRGSVFSEFADEPDEMRSRRFKSTSPLFPPELPPTLTRTLSPSGKVLIPDPSDPSKLVEGVMVPAASQPMIVSAAEGVSSYFTGRPDPKDRYFKLPDATYVRGGTKPKSLAEMAALRAYIEEADAETAAVGSLIGGGSASQSPRSGSPRTGSPRTLSPSASTAEPGGEDTGSSSADDGGWLTARVVGPGGRVFASKPKKRDAAAVRAEFRAHGSSDEEEGDALREYNPRDGFWKDKPQGPGSDMRFTQTTGAIHTTNPKMDDAVRERLGVQFVHRQNEARVLLPVTQAIIKSKGIPLPVVPGVDGGSPTGGGAIVPYSPGRSSTGAPPSQEEIEEWERSYRSQPLTQQQLEPYRGQERVRRDSLGQVIGPPLSPGRSPTRVGSRGWGGSDPPNPGEAFRPAAPPSVWEKQPYSETYPWVHMDPPEPHPNSLSASQASSSRVGPGPSYDTITSARGPGGGHGGGGRYHSPPPPGSPGGSPGGYFTPPAGPAAGPSGVSGGGGSGALVVEDRSAFMETIAHSSVPEFAITRGGNVRAESGKEMGVYGGLRSKRLGIAPLLFTQYGIDDQGMIAAAVGYVPPHSPDDPAQGGDPLAKYEGAVVWRESGGGAVMGMQGGAAREAGLIQPHQHGRSRGGGGGHYSQQPPASPMLAGSTGGSGFVAAGGSTGGGIPWQPDTAGAGASVLGGGGDGGGGSWLGQSFHQDASLMNSVDRSRGSHGGLPFVREDDGDASDTSSLAPLAPVKRTRVISAPLLPRAVPSALLDAPAPTGTAGVFGGSPGRFTPSGFPRVELPGLNNLEMQTSVDSVPMSVASGAAALISLTSAGNTVDFGRYAKSANGLIPESLPVDTRKKHRSLMTVAEARSARAAVGGRRILTNRDIFMYAAHVLSFITYAEAEWLENAGDYLSSRAGVHEFVAAVAHRIDKAYAEGDGSVMAFGSSSRYQPNASGMSAGSGAGGGVSEHPSRASAAEPLQQQQQPATPGADWWHGPGSRGGSRPGTTGRLGTAATGRAETPAGVPRTLAADRATAGINVQQGGSPDGGDGNSVSPGPSFTSAGAVFGKPTPSLLAIGVGAGPSLASASWSFAEGGGLGAGRYPGGSSLAAKPNIFSDDCLPLVYHYYMRAHEKGVPPLFGSRPAAEMERLEETRLAIRDIRASMSKFTSHKKAKANMLGKVNLDRLASDLDDVALRLAAVRERLDLRRVRRMARQAAALRLLIRRRGLAQDAKAAERARLAAEDFTAQAASLREYVAARDAALSEADAATWADMGLNPGVVATSKNARATLRALPYAASHNYTETLHTAGATPWLGPPPRPGPLRLPPAPTMPANHIFDGPEPPGWGRWEKIDPEPPVPIAAMETILEKYSKNKNLIRAVRGASANPWLNEPLPATPSKK